MLKSISWTSCFCPQTTLYKTIYIYIYIHTLLLQPTLKAKDRLHEFLMSQGVWISGSELLKLTKGTGLLNLPTCVWLQTAFTSFTLYRQECHTAESLGIPQISSLWQITLCIRPCRTRYYYQPYLCLMSYIIQHWLGCSLTKASLVNTQHWFWHLNLILMPSSECSVNYIRPDHLLWEPMTMTWRTTFLF